MATIPRRRLRSASVQLGALTALALTLTGCNAVGDDDDDYDDCSIKRRKAVGMPVVASAPLTASGTATTVLAAGQPQPEAALPDTGGFGTHLAACGG